MTAVDTNILFYAHDPRDIRKRDIAVELIASLHDTGVLLWQVGCEYLAVSRKLETFGYSRAQATAATCALYGLQLLRVGQHWIGRSN